MVPKEITNTKTATIPASIRRFARSIVASPGRLPAIPPVVVVLKVIGNP